MPVGARGSGGLLHWAEARAEDRWLLANHGYVTLSEGEARAALHVLEGSLALICKRVLPADHLDIASSMSNLAGAFGALGDQRERSRIITTNTS